MAFFQKKNIYILFIKPFKVTKLCLCTFGLQNVGPYNFVCTTKQN